MSANLPSSQDENKRPSITAPPGGMGNLAPQPTATQLIDMEKNGGDVKDPVAPVPLEWSVALSSAATLLLEAKKAEDVYERTIYW